MRIFQRSGLVPGLALLVGAAIALGTPARAGDDEDCYSASVSPWTVYYESGCQRDISRTLRVGTGTRFVNARLVFSTSGPLTSGPTALRVVSETTGSSLTAKVGRRAALKSTGTGGNFAFPAAAASEVMAALRQNRSVTITVTYTSGARQVFTLDGTNFEAAYQRLLRG